MPSRFDECIANNIRQRIYAAAIRRLRPGQSSKPVLSIEVAIPTPIGVRSPRLRQGPTFGPRSSDAKRSSALPHGFSLSHSGFPSGRASYADDVRDSAQSASESDYRRYDVLAGRSRMQV